MSNTIGSPRGNTQDADDLFQRNGRFCGLSSRWRASLTPVATTRNQNDRARQKNGIRGSPREPAIKSAWPCDALSRRLNASSIVGQPYSITATRQPARGQQTGEKQPPAGARGTIPARKDRIVGPVLSALRTSLSLRAPSILLKLPSN